MLQSISSEFMHFMVDSIQGSIQHTLASSSNYDCHHHHHHTIVRSQLSIARNRLLALPIDSGLQ